jgi:hypothetical protein
LYRKYAPGDTVLEGLEKDAREGCKGLWADPQPVPPWEWRKKFAEATAFGGKLSLVPYHFRYGITQFSVALHVFFIAQEVGKLVEDNVAN